MPKCDNNTNYKVNIHLKWASPPSLLPNRDRAGYDVIAASLGGLLHITGPRGGPPAKVGVALTDLCTGLYVHGAVMAALLQRGRTGKGQKIDADLLSTQVSHFTSDFDNYKL